MTDWSERGGSRTLDLAVVRVQERATGGEYDGVPEAVTVVAADPNDLAGLAMRFRDRINRARRPGGGVVYFEPVTFLLQYHGVQSVFNFPHTLAGQFRETGVVGLFGADATPVEEQTLARPDRPRRGRLGRGRRVDAE
jgi:hypothetical protein